jgi:hypothetical protein
MDSLVGRTKELEYLSNVYTKIPVSCAVCGRKHLGKTAILKEFCRDKPHIYVSGTIGLSSDNLSMMEKELSAFRGRPVRLSDVGEFFQALKMVCAKQPVVVIIDNYSDLIVNFPEFTSYMRAFINRDLPATKIMLIVCDTDSSVFGRFYYTLDVHSMSYKDCMGFHPDYTPLQHLITYSVVGGTPAYQLMFQGDPGDVIRTQFFNHMSVFLLEVESMVGTEASLRAPSIKALAAIAAGAESLNDIADRAGLRMTVCRDVISELEHKGMVRKEVSQSKRTVYYIHSNILKFYYTVIDRYIHEVAFRSSEEAYEMAKPDIDAYMEKLFENICVDYIVDRYDCDTIGKPRKKDNSPDDIINFVAIVEESSVMRTLLATCRLYGDKYGKGDLEDLRERGKSIKGTNRLFVMFSAVGFSADLQEIASKDHNVRLVSLDEIYS